MWSLAIVETCHDQQQLETDAPSWARDPNPETSLEAPKASLALTP